MDSRHVNQFHHDYGTTPTIGMMVLVTLVLVAMAGLKLLINYLQ
ncbi:hypothetical protein MMIC_P0927 [Mariprofundus micogutta]|uniref:Uncharacterized protein n=1 Tax=Mariprofundus micogutta TaxID=1921010 RepID=A0A1L8CM35_9PROT|nr:hypothetical protein [Mariprofundus micogutta]GAV19966.1 hypothetical protein MMIC_P0927 [Mariprofundus micogutta]